MLNCAVKTGTFKESSLINKFQVCLIITWNINVHWYNSVTTSDNSIGVVVVAPSIGTTETGSVVRFKFEWRI